MPFSHLTTKPLGDILAAHLTQRRCLAAAAILYTMMIAIGSIPGKAQALSAATNDKLLHFLAYGLLSALVYGGLTVQGVMRGFCVLVTIGAMGALDEAIQALLPYREASWRDWEVDMVAALICVVILALWRSLHSVPDRQTAVSKVRPERSE